MKYRHTHIWHDDVIKWKHFPRNWPFVRRIHRSLVNSPHKGQWRGAFMFSLICAWINRWVNNREAGNLRRSRHHYDIIVMGNDYIDAEGWPRHYKIALIACIAIYIYIYENTTYVSWYFRSLLRSFLLIILYEMYSFCIFDFKPIIYTYSRNPIIYNMLMVNDKRSHMYRIYLSLFVKS